VFIRALLDTNSLPNLNSNNLLRVASYVDPSASISMLDTSNSCGGANCSGALLQITVPDSSGMGTEVRWHDVALGNNNFTGPSFKGCIITEKFTAQELSEFVFKFKFTAGFQGEYVRLDAVYLSQQFPYDQLTTATAPSLWTGNQYELINQLGSWNQSNWVVIHDNASYPNNANIYQLELTPIPNTPNVDTVTVAVVPGTALLFQPFTDLVGGTVVNDTSRHHLEVLNNNGAICVEAIVEVIWDPNESYVHNGGVLDMQGGASCFLFREGSSLVVSDHKTLKFGGYARGILALRPGAEVRIGNGAELVIGHMLDIREEEGAIEPGKVEITLGAGSKLSFAPWSSIHNANSIGGQMKLHVYLDGGQLDISELSAQDQLKVVIHTLPQEDLAEPLLIGNPVTDRLIVNMDSRESAKVIFRIYGVQGRLVSETQQVLSKGQNELSFQIAGYDSGTYVIEAMGPNGYRASGRFVKY
jgi:hypothetical protein